MFRSLHMKLMLIMMLLIMSLMTITGIFLVNSVSGFYLEQFYAQISEAFADPDFSEALQTPADGETSGAAGIRAVLEANVGALGVDSMDRNYFILSSTGQYLAGSAPREELPPDATPNLLTAIAGSSGYASAVAADYMDVAVPLTRGGSSYIIYILDDRSTMQQLNSQLSTLIIEALVFGILIAVLLSFVTSKALTGPIERLTRGAERLASGDFNNKIEVASRDEIGVLTGTFNNMARQLKETISEVENERNKLDALFLHMTDGVIAFARDGSVIQSNPAAREMLGRTLDPWDRYEELFAHIAPRDKLLSLPQSGCLRGEEQVNGRSLEIFLAPFSGEGQGGVMAVIHDVTLQRRTEAKQKEFVANVSHELRTPLTNIRSYAETLAEAGDDIPAATRSGFLTVILNESDRMTHIVQDLLTLSRFDSGKMELNLSRFSFAKAVQDVYDAVLMEAKRHGHTLTISLEHDLPDILADRNRVTQVMMNIVSNSIKYTPDGGLIRMSAGRTESGDQVWMKVADNGIGIPPEDRDRIFDRFYRVDKARSRQSGGTGLGLSIAKEIIALHGGTIGLEDNGQPGLTVRITLWIEGPDHEA